MKVINEFHLPDTHPLHMKTLLAMDFGEKYIGVATYCVNRDPFPTPYGRIANKTQAQVLLELKKIISDESVDEVIIGLPYLTDGKKTASTGRAQTFADWIKASIQTPVHEQDETLSTFEAQNRMKNSPRYNFQVDQSQIDAVAASVILEDFIRRTIGNLRL
ncbi:MAG TPA: Holliday junction resolvase RuvX [Bacteriovoracaceae bacterium]|nr:Holliday junction resolvase RuvX [Bacteriovoracaceae bacterium]